MKVIKYLFIGIFALLVLGIGAASFFLYTLDLNAYKELIVEKAQEATGRTLDIQGDIGHSLFPRLGLTLGQTQFGNAPGFGDAPMVSVEEVDVHVEFLPLLKKKIHASKIKLHGVNANLQTNAKGVTNWDDLISETTGTDASATEDSSAASDFELVVNGVEITEAKVLWQDDQAGTKIRVEPFNLILGEIAEGKPTDVNLDFNMNSAAPVLDASFQLVTTAIFDIAAQTLQLEGMEVVLHSTGESFPNGAMDLQLRADVSGNFVSQEYALKNATIDIAGTGDAFPEGKLDAQLKTNIEANLEKETLGLSSLVVSMLDTELTGNASVTSFEKPQVKFSLASKKLDLDKLLPTSSAEEKQEENAQRSTTSDNEPIELPTQTLRDLHVNGDISVGTLIISGMTMTNLKATLKAKEGLLQVSPMSMNLYEGTMKGQANVDVRGKTPRYGLGTDISNVQIEPLSIDFMGDENAYIRGVSNVALDVKTTGNSVAELKRALAGKVVLNAANGALRDAKLAANVEQAAALLKGRSPKPSGEELVFDKLFGTYNISKGVANNNDLVLNTPLIHADGAGNVDIGQSVADYKISIRLSEEPGKCGVPITVKGPFESPRYGVDSKALLQCTASEEIEEEKEKLKEDLAEEIDKSLGEGVGKELLDKLKIF